MPRLGNDEPIPMIPPKVPETRASALGEVQDYNHDLMNVPEMWRTTMGKGVRVAVLDSGVPNHPDITVSGSKSFVPGYFEDLCGHATASGGVLAAVADNGFGVKGVAPDVEDLYCAVLDRNGTGTVRHIVDGVYWAVDQKVDVINMSLGIPGEYGIDKELEKACDYAESKGVCLFASSGNTGRSVNHPARYDSVIAVAAVDRNGKVPDFSSRGAEVEFAAGGVDVYTCYKNGGYASMSGTSFSCPAVCGIGCLVKAAFRRNGADLTPDGVRTALRKVCVDVGDPGRDPLSGYGIPVFTKNAGNLFGEGSAASIGRQSFWKRVWNAIMVLASGRRNS